MQISPRYPLSHAACKEPASPAPSLPYRFLIPAVAPTTAPRLRAFGPRCSSCPAAASPLRWPALNPARQLAACRQLPFLILHHARGCATGFIAPANAVPSAPTFALVSTCAFCPPPAPSASLMASAATPEESRPVRCAQGSPRQSRVNSPLRVEL
jgi:hypothetical protein